jgi:transposase InsO family protein
MRSKDKTGGGAETRGSKRVFPVEVRVQMAQAIVDRGASATALGEAFGISRFTLMDWAQQYRRLGVSGLEYRGRKRGGPRRSADPRREAVVRARREHPEQGTRRIRDVVERYQGLGISETTVRRILHEEGLLEQPVEVPAKPRPAERAFERAEPNQLWQSDIFTFLLRRHERIYVTAFMDDYSRYLVSLAMAHHQRSSLVLEALARGIEEYGVPREVLTDQGRQYVAWRGHTDFEEELRRQGIRHLKSRPHHPQTLGKIERFWKTLWEELLSRTVFGDFKDCERRVGLFVQAYNFRRPHQGIGGLVPADRFFRAAPQVREAIERSVASNAMELAKRRPQRKPFYLVGRLGERDLWIALSGSGLLVKLGDMEETIPLGREAEHEEAQASRWGASAPVAADAEVAALGAGGSDGEGALPDAAERAVWGEAGDGRDHGSGDLAGDVLPAGDACAGRDAAGTEPAGAGDAGGGGESSGADRGAGRQAQEGGGGEAAVGAAALDDAARGEGERDAAWENRLDPAWEESFARLAEGAGGEAGEGFEPDYGWRAAAVKWRRKLMGADEVSDGEGLHADASGARATEGSLPGDHGGPVGSDLGERGGAEAGPVAEPLPERDAPWSKGADPWHAGGAWPSGSAGVGTAAAAGGAAAAAGERAAQEARGDDRAGAGPGPGPAAGPDGSQSEES